MSPSQNAPKLGVRERKERAGRTSCGSVPSCCAVPASVLHNQATSRPRPPCPKLRLPIGNSAFTSAFSGCSPLLPLDVSYQPSLARTRGTLRRAVSNRIAYCVYGFEFLIARCALRIPSAVRDLLPCVISFGDCSYKGHAWLLGLKD